MWHSCSLNLMMFLKLFHICKNISFDILGVFRILLETSKIATDLFVIKLSTCKGLVYLVTFLWHVKELGTLDTCVVSTMLLSVLSLVVHKTPKSDKMSKSILAYLFPHFIKSTPPCPFHIKYTDTKKISVCNEKWYLRLCNSFSLWGVGMKILI